MLRFNFESSGTVYTNIRLRITINDGGTSTYDIFFPDADSIVPFSIYLGATKERTISVDIEMYPFQNDARVINLAGIELHEVRQPAPPVSGNANP